MLKVSKKMRLAVVGLVGLSLLLFLVGSSFAVAAEQKLTFHIVTHANIANVFFSAVNRGFQDFCNAYGIKGVYVGTREDGDVGEMLANLETLVAAGESNGAALVIANASMLDRPAKMLISMGVPVVAINTADFRPPEERIPYLIYVGENSYESGRANAKMVLDKFTELAGRPPKRSAYFIHVPGVLCLEERGQGMADVLTSAGVKFDKVAARFDPSEFREGVRAWIEKYPDVETIHTGFSDGAGWAADVLKEMGRLGNVNEPFKEGKIYVGGIDVDPILLREIIKGNVIGTIDQQPYLQGYYGGLLLYHWVKYRCLPAEDINTGAYVVDQSNAETILPLSEEGIRR